MSLNKHDTLKDALHYAQERSQDTGKTMYVHLINDETEDEGYVVSTQARHEECIPVAMVTAL